MTMNYERVVDIYIWWMTGIWYDPRMFLNDCDYEM